jgi:6-phosphogluconate dehydrogenase (decarboxylating)
VFAERINALGADYIDAPVSGGEVGAKAASLTIMCGGDEAVFNRVLPLNGEWLECFWCDHCETSSWWHVKRHEGLDYTLSPVPRELWEQGTGVIRAEGNPTVSDFSRRQARATGVTGLRQYRFL